MTDELPDNDFQNGLKRMGDLLSQLDDADLVWEYASWVMLKDEIIGAKVVSITTDSLAKGKTTIVFLTIGTIYKPTTKILGIVFLADIYTRSKETSVG